MPGTVHSIPRLGTVHNFHSFAIKDEEMGTVHNEILICIFHPTLVNI